MQTNAIEDIKLLPEILAQFEAKLLKEIQNNNEPERYLNAKEAAHYLGISERLFNERLKLGFWSCYRVGRRRLFRPSDLDANLAKFKEQSRFSKERNAV